MALVEGFRVYTERHHDSDAVWGQKVKKVATSTASMVLFASEPVPEEDATVVEHPN